MGKTGNDFFFKRHPKIVKNHDDALKRVGPDEGFEYRIKPDDPEFNPIGIYCYKCGEFHRSPYEGKWIHPDVPLRVGKNWAKAHDIQSIIESRSIIFERKIGKKSLSPQTWVDTDSFKPQSGWVPYQIISKSGEVTTIGKIHSAIKIKNTKPKDINIPKGFVIYTTKESDQSVHEILASIMNYTPQSLINSYYPSDITGYDYRRPLDLKGPTPKISYWSVYNERGNAEILLKRIREQFPDDGQVKIEIPYGVELE